MSETPSLYNMQSIFYTNGSVQIHTTILAICPNPYNKQFVQIKTKIYHGMRWATGSDAHDLGCCTTAMLGVSGRSTSHMGHRWLGRWRVRQRRCSTEGMGGGTMTPQHTDVVVGHRTTVAQRRAPPREVVSSSR
jgi:hypothetical protein